MELVKSLVKNGYVNLNYSLLDNHREDLEAIKQLAVTRKKNLLFKQNWLFQRIRKVFGYKTLKNFLFELLKSDDYKKIDYLRNIASSDAINNIVTAYLGEEASLHGMGLWYSKVNNSLKKSQLYHFDHGKPRTFLKVFILLGDVQKNNGPLTFFDAESSENFEKKLSSQDKGFERERKFSDEEINEFLAPEKAMQHIGHFGAAYIVDPNRCLHQGGRVKKNERVMLMLSYSADNNQNLKAKALIGNYH